MTGRKDTNMTPVLFINCSRWAFVDWIIGGLKLYETRTKNTLKKFLDTYLGQRILIAETGKDDPLVRCSAVIDEVVAVYDQSTWEDYLQFTWVPVDSDYDWKPDTKVKHLYHLKDVRPIAKPFRLPKSAHRHGRIWAEYVWGSAL